MKGYDSNEVDPTELLSTEIGQTKSSEDLPGPADGILRRPPRARAGHAPWILLAIAAAGVLGFAVGRHNSVTGRTPSPAHSVPVSPSSSPFTYLTTLETKCSIQIGHQLQLGVEFVNQGNTKILILSVRPTFPLGGLREVRTERGTCGQLAAGDISHYALDPGSTVWVRTIVDVRVTCPTPLPVLFEVTYAVRNGPTTSSQLPAFADLGGVPYSGCS